MKNSPIRSIMINRNKSDLIGNIYVACVLQYLILYHGCPNTYAKSPLPLIAGLDEQFQKVVLETTSGIFLIYYVIFILFSEKWLEREIKYLKNLKCG